MEAEQINPLCDYTNGPSVFNLAEKNEDDQFPLKCIRKDKISHDTYEFELEFPDKEWTSGVWPGGHYKMHIESDGKWLCKPYSPISPLTRKGSVIFCIKIYREHPDFPNGGKFTRALEAGLNVGGSILCEGPIGMINYKGFGNFTFKKKPIEHKKTKIGLISGGTGITPFFSIAQASLLGNDGLQIRLLYVNKTKGDILIKKEIDELAAKYPNNFKVFYSLTRHTAEDGPWDGLNGRVSMEMLKQCDFPDNTSDDVLILNCGPPGFNEANKKILEENGYKQGVQYV